jgi:hypothetical protein
MSFPEDEPVVGVHPLKQTRAYQFLPPLLFFSGIAYGVWALGSGLFHLGEASSVAEISPTLSAMASTTTVSAPAAPTAPGVVMAPAAPSGAAAASPAGETPSSDGESSAVIYISHDNDAPAQPARPQAPARPAPPPKPVRQWRLRGTVYDLLTLQPISGASVVFIDQTTNHRNEAQTDSEGRYRTVLAPLADRGYSVAIRKDGYSTNYLDPSVQEVAKMRPEARRQIGRDLASTFAPQPAYVQPASEKPLNTDFYLAPNR